MLIMIGDNGEMQPAQLHKKMDWNDIFKRAMERKTNSMGNLRDNIMRGHQKYVFYSNSLCMIKIKRDESRLQKETLT